MLRFVLFYRYACEKGRRAAEDKRRSWWASFVR